MGTAVQLPLAFCDNLFKISACYEVFEAEILLAFTTEAHDVRKPHIHDVGVRLDTYRLDHATQGKGGNQGKSGYNESNLFGRIHTRIQLPIEQEEHTQLRRGHI